MASTDDPVPDAEGMIQINVAARLPPNEFAQLLNPFFGWTLRGWVAALVRVVDHRDPDPATASSPVIWSVSPMKGCLAPFAIATSLFAPVAHANDALEAKVRAYAPIVSLAKV